MGELRMSIAVPATRYSFYTDFPSAVSNGGERSIGCRGMCYSDPQQPTDAALDQYLGPLVSSSTRKELINRYAVSLAPNPLRGIESELRKCTVPTRIVWGMSDNIFSTKNPDYLYSILPQMMGITRLRTAKLFFPEERPEVIAREARNLWELSSVRFFNNA
jgi:haloalkane dehalogenase